MNVIGDGGEVLGIIKDYLAIARGTLAVTANAAVAGGKSAVTALATLRPGHLLEAQDRFRGTTPGNLGNDPRDELDSIAATIQGEIERVLASLELVSRAELDSVRQRLAQLERRIERQSRLGGAGDLDQANR